MGVKNTKNAGILPIRAILSSVVLLGRGVRWLEYLPQKTAILDKKITKMQLFPILFLTNPIISHNIPLRANAFPYGKSISPKAHMVSLSQVALALT